MAIVSVSGIGIGITISGIIVGSVGSLGGGSAPCGGVGWCVGFISYVIFFHYSFFLSFFPPSPPLSFGFPLFPLSFSLVSLYHASAIVFVSVYSSSLLCVWLSLV
jgi:hypothetical protein